MLNSAPWHFFTFSIEVTSKLSRYWLLLSCLVFAACQGQPDTLEDTGTPPPLGLPALEIIIEPPSQPVLREELFGNWEITALDDWAGEGRIYFTGESTIFHYQCNQMSVKGALLDEDKWYVPRERYATTEAGCQGIKGEQDKVLTSLMIGPSTVTSVSDGSDVLSFSIDDHKVEIRRIWSNPAEKDISQENLTGKWNILRFDDFVPPSRLNLEGKSSAYIYFHDNNFYPNSMYANFHIGCNYAENYLQLKSNKPVSELVHIPRSLDGIATERGCTPHLHELDTQFFSMMYEKPKVERFGEHRLRLWTEEHELILEKSEIGQMRHAIRNFNSLEGKWRVTMVNNDGMGLGGHFFTPELLEISRRKIQYGNFRPYLENPTIRGANIKGEVTGSLDEHNCVEDSTYAFQQKKFATKENALCIVLRVLTGESIAEPTQLPDHFQLALGEYQITLMRDGAETLSYPE